MCQPKTDRRLRPTERIQRPGEFQAVFRGGRCFRDPLLRIHFLENRRELSRLGLVISRKVGGAVARNRLKRIFREIFRESKGRLPEPLDLVLVPGSPGGGGDRRAYGAAFERFLSWYRPKPPGRGRERTP